MTQQPIALIWAKRYPWVVALVAIGLISLGGAWWLWRQLPAVDQQMRLRTIDGQSTLAAVASSPLLRAELAHVSEVARRIDANVADELAVDVNYGYFYSLETRTRARLSDLRPIGGGLPDPRSPYKRVSFALQLNGTYEQVAEFLRQLENGPRLARIGFFNLSRRDASGGSVTLDLTVDLLGKQ